MLGALDPATFTGQMCVPRAARTVEVERARAKRRGLGQISSGCKVNEAGIVPCDPEVMRRRVEAKLHTLGLYPRSKRLDFNVYAMARNIHSEGGRGTGAEKLALGEALVNRARARGDSMFSLISRNGRFAAQRGCSPCASGRQDAAWDDLVAAELVLTGRSGNITRGATHYFSPKTQDFLFREGRTRRSALSVYDSWSTGGDLLTWVGFVPGIDIRRQLFLKKEPKTPAGRARNRAMRPLGRAAMQQESPADVLRPGTCRELVAEGIGGGVVVAAVSLLAAAAPFYFIMRDGQRFSVPWG